MACNSLHITTPSARPNRAASRRLALGGPSLLAMLVIALPVRAQTDSTGTTADTLVLDPISVAGTGIAGPGPNLGVPGTAGSRLSLTPLETPASVEIIDGTTIRDRGQLDVNQAIVQNGIGINFLGTPGNGGTSLGMRGFAGHGSVTRLYDGTRLYPASGTITFPFDTWTVDRIEILRGPASVLYGEGAIGGAINIIPKKPLTTGRRNEARTVFDTSGLKALAFGSAGPIDDGFAYNLDVSAKHTDGWVERGDASSIAFSGGLRWQATPDIAFTLSHDHGYQRPSAYFGTPLIDGELKKRLRDENYNVRDGKISYEDNLTQFEAEWTPSDSLALSSTTYYLESDRTWRNVESYRWNAATDLIDRSSYIAINHDLKQWGNRSDATVRTAFGGIENETVVGFDVNRMAFTHTNNSPYTGNSTVPQEHFDPGTFDSPAPYRPTFDAVTHQYSVFLDNRLKLDEHWSLVGGIRYDHPEVERENLLNGTGFTKTMDSWNWRAGVVYTPIPDLAFYAQYSKAAEPIGNILTLNDTQKDYELPVGEQYEVGVKHAFMGGRGEATLAAFYIDKRDTLARDPNDPTITRQVGRQTSKGIEAAVGFAFTDTLRLDVNGTILEAEYKDYVQAGGDFSGKTPPNVPQEAANAWLTWDFAHDWRAHAGVEYVGSTFTGDSNENNRSSYGIVNAGLQWDPVERMTVGLFVYNLFDEFYATSGGDTQQIVGQPLTAMLSLDVRF